MTVQPSPAQITAGVKALRAELTSISNWLVDYNSKISDQQATQAVTLILTAGLNAAPAPAPKPPTPPNKSTKGKVR